MKASTRKKISAGLKRYHACARRGGCGKRRGKKNRPRKRRVALTQVKSKRKRGKVSRGASKGQRTAARMLRELEKKAPAYDKKFGAVVF